MIATLTAELRRAAARGGAVIGGITGSFQQWLFGGYRAAYGLAVMRIVFGLCIFGTIAASWIDRHYIWGGGARWLTPRVNRDDYGWPFTAYFRLDDSPGVVDVKLAVVALVGLLIAVGWRTRLVLPIAMVLWTSLIRINPMGPNAGDRIVQIIGFYACFADTTRHWSLDARRRARRATAAPTGRPRRLAGMVPQRPAWLRVPAWLPVLFNNVAVITIAGQIFVIYLVSSLYKVQGTRWQDGTAIYYPIRLDRFEVWPWFNEVLGRWSPVVVLVTYATVFIQLFFPLLMLRKSTRTFAVVAIIGMHIGIAVTMGLVWFSLAIIGADMVLVRDQTFAGIQRIVQRMRSKPRASPPLEPATDPATT